MSLSETETLIGSIYEASASDELWSKVIRDMASVFGRAAVSIDYQASIGHVDPLVEFCRFDAELAALHFEEFSTEYVNPGLAALLQQPAGTPFSLSSFVDRETYKTDLSIQGILRPQGIDKVLLCATEKSRSSLAYVNIFGHTNQPDFSEADHALLQHLSTHISRSFEYRKLIRARQMQQAVALSTLENESDLAGLILVSTRGVLLEADASATAILERQAILRVKDGKLYSSSRLANEDMESLQRFLSANIDDAKPFVIALNGRAKIILDKSPVNADVGSWRHPDSLLLRIRFFHIRSRFHLGGLAATYGLTNGEARALNALVGSKTATEAAQRLGITRDTMKSHQSRIYEKTGCESLMQLMLLVGRFG